MKTALQLAAEKHSTALRALDSIRDIAHRLQSGEISLATAKAQALWSFPPVKTKAQLLALVDTAKEELASAVTEYHNELAVSR